MATSKSGGSTQNGRDSQSKRLGVKLFDGQLVLGGEIIVRQKGTKFAPGENVDMGRDFTIFATKTGKVKFTEKAVRRFDGRRYEKSFVNIEVA